MSGRFLMQKFFSGMSRSISLLGNQESACARAAAPAARYFNTFTCSQAGAKTSWPQCEIPLIRKPIFVDCVRVTRRTFSSSATNKQVSSRAKMHPEVSGAEHFHALNKSANTTMALFAFTGLCWVYMFNNKSSGDYSSCCDCRCHSSNK